MEINELQKLVTVIVKKLDAKYPGKHDSDTTIIHLIEELGELASQIYNKKYGRERVNQELLESGFCDCIILLLQLANTHEVNVENAISKKLKKIKKSLKI